MTTKSGLLMRASEVARQTKMSRALVNHHIQAGHLKSSDVVGGVPMFTREAVAAFLAGRIEEVEKRLTDLRQQHDRLITG